jgi:hypothetical protein
MNKTNLIIAGLLLILITGTIFYYYEKQISPPKHQRDPTPTTKQINNNFKSCKKKEDCVLFLCAGCVNTEWAKTAPPDLPCATYVGYSGCGCVNNTCTEVK